MKTLVFGKPADQITRTTRNSKKWLVGEESKKFDNSIVPKLSQNRTQMEHAMVSRSTATIKVGIAKPENQSIGEQNIYTEADEMFIDKESA